MRDRYLRRQRAIEPAEIDEAEARREFAHALADALVPMLGEEDVVIGAEEVGLRRRILGAAVVFGAERILARADVPNELGARLGCFWNAAVIEIKRHADRHALGLGDALVGLGDGAQQFDGAPA